MLRRRGPCAAWVAAQAAAIEPRLEKALRRFDAAKPFWFAPIGESPVLESAETGHRISKSDYAREEPKLREALLNAQYDLSLSGRGPVLSSSPASKAGAAAKPPISSPNGWTLGTSACWRSAHRRPEEQAHPPAWRYWRALPPRGKIGIFMNAWYNELLAARVEGKIGDSKLEARMTVIREHERMLTDEGLVLLKFWIHLSKSAQKERMRELADDPLTRWRVTRDDRTRARIYAKSHDLWEHLLRETSIAEAPWYVVEGADERYRSLTVGKILLEALERTIAAKKAQPTHTPTPPPPAVIDNVKLIRGLDLTQKVSARKYDRGVERFQGRLAQLTRSKRFDEESLVLVFEGADAAGKGGAIRRVAAALDARQYGIVPVAAPSEEERAHPYLWRFWRQIPSHREIVDLRPLVVRARARRAGRSHCTPSDWMRAYDEINPIRGAARRRRRDRDQVLAADQQGGAAAALSASARRRHSSASRSRPTTGAIARSGCLRSGRLRHGRPHQHRDRPWTLVEARTSTSRASRSSKRSSSGWRTR
jgi:polyphosphate kinase 2 (PPK2 family)